ncbi:MAG TPA: hypothetical protein VF668_19685 [Pyrinomonadaceae bacterium]
MTDALLEQLDERIRRIAEEVFQTLSAGRNDGQDGWLSYAQIVELTGLSEWTIGEAVRRGELEADYPLPRCPRVKRSKLREWMERNNKERDGAGVPDRRRA